MPLRLIAIISKANSPYFTLPLHGLWASPRPATAWNSSYNGWLPTVSYETQSPTVIGLLSHPFPVSRPRPWTSDFRKWRREWGEPPSLPGGGGGTEKIIPSLKRQLTFIRSANWYKANGGEGIKGPSNVSLRTWETPASDRTWLWAKLIRRLRPFDMESGRLQILWTAKTAYAKPVNTLYFPAINGFYKIHIFVWRSSGTNT